MTLNNPSYYDNKLKIGENVHNYRDFYIKKHNLDMYVGCMGEYVVGGYWVI